MLKQARTALSAAALLTLAACGGGDGGAGGAQPQMGALSLSVTDAPVDGAARVVVEFTGVEVKARNEERPEIFTFATPRQIDLLALDGGGSEILLEDEVLPAGAYEWIRLKVNAGLNASDSFVELLDGSVHPLFIPSGNQTGLKLVRGFVVPVGGVADFTIDFNLRRSVIRPPGLGGTYLLKPALRIVDNSAVGAIAGEVAAAIAADPGCTAVVYVFSGAGISPDDEGSATPPLVTTGVRLNNETGVYRYKAGFLPPGDYTAALTCEADADDPEADDDIAFIDPQDAVVVAGEVTPINFPADGT